MPELNPVVHRFLDYVQVETRSQDPESDDHPRPTTPGQLDLITILKDQFREMSMFEQAKKKYPLITLGEIADGSFTVHFPATPGMKAAPNTWLAAHVDTYYGVCGVVKPIIHDYDGGDIELPSGDIVIPAQDLDGLIGQKLITGDGSSLLGADDKGGVAVLMEIINKLCQGEIEAHGPLTFWFCVDEEIGELGFPFLPKEDIAACDLFLTVDGGRLGHIDVGGFFCRQVKMVFSGQDAHPGEYPDKLMPSHYAAMLFATLMAQRYNLPKAGIEDPESSYFYVSNIEGSASKTTVSLAPRAFSLGVSDEIMALVRDTAQEAADEYGCTFELTKDHMATVNNEMAIRNRPQYLEMIHRVHNQLDIQTSEHLVRGGTDGSMLNVMLPDIPTPNIGYGSINIHGEQETLVVAELEQTVTVVRDIIVALSEMTP